VRHNLIEKFFAKVKENRGIAVRSHKTSQRFSDVRSLVAALILSKLFSSDHNLVAGIIFRHNALEAARSSLYVRP
jgi:hypothetical protein